MKYTKNEIVDSIKRVQKYIKENKRRPNTVKVGNKVIRIDNYLKLTELVNARNRINQFIKLNGRYPNTVNIETVIYNMKEYRILYNLTVVTNTIKPSTDNSNSVADLFFKTFGKKNTIDECLKAIENHGYSYYYNDKYTNKETIKRIKNKLGVNCTDSCHLMYWIGRALGYDVRCLHVMCKSGGHVRLQFRHKKHTSGNWINRDPAAILSTGNNNGIVGNIWCPDGRLVAIDPVWWKNDLKR